MTRPLAFSDLHHRDDPAGAILEAIMSQGPRLAVCGHIHDSRGVRGRIGATEVALLGPLPSPFTP